MEKLKSWIKHHDVFCVGFAIAFLFLLVLVTALTGRRKLFSYFFAIIALSACDQDWSHWHDTACAFRPCPLEISTNSRLKRDHLESSSSTTKTLYLNYYIAYGHQTWLGADLPWGALTDKITWPFGQVVLGNCVKI